jgi:hypothetical protein
MDEIIVDISNEASRSQAVRRLAEMLNSVKLLQVGQVALLCGTLVEHGADPHIPLQPVLNRLKEALEAVMTADDRQLHEAVEAMCLAAIAMLSRSASARQAAKTDTILVSRVQEHSATLGGGAVSFLDVLLRTLDDEELVILHPGLWRGYRVVIRGIADNFQLHTLLADTRIGDPDQGCCGCRAGSTGGSGGRFGPGHVQPRELARATG